MTKYTAEYFYNKFAAIPESKWTTGFFVNAHNKCCALGHCGFRCAVTTPEGSALKKLFANNGLSVVGVNDEFSEFGNTPKERILNALTFIASGIYDALA